MTSNLANLLFTLAMVRYHIMSVSPRCGKSDLKVHEMQIAWFP